MRFLRFASRSANTCMYNTYSVPSLIQNTDISKFTACTEQQSKATEKAHLLTRKETDQTDNMKKEIRRVIRMVKMNRTKKPGKPMKRRAKSELLQTNFNVTKDKKKVPRIF